MTTGAAAFSAWESWNYFDAFYYCFITLTTIGFGDYVALQKDSSLQTKPEYVIFSIVFILFGLSVVSAAINLLILRFLTLNTEDERRDEAEAALTAAGRVRLEGDVITGNESIISGDDAKDDAIGGVGDFFENPEVASVCSCTCYGNPRRSSTSAAQAKRRKSVGVKSTLVTMTSGSSTSCSGTTALVRRRSSLSTSPSSLRSFTMRGNANHNAIRHRTGFKSMFGHFSRNNRDDIEDKSEIIIQNRGRKASTFSTASAAPAYFRRYTEDDVNQEVVVGVLEEEDDLADFALDEFHSCLRRSKQKDFDENAFEEDEDDFTTVKSSQKLFQQQEMKTMLPTHVTSHDSRQQHVITIAQHHHSRDSINSNDDDNKPVKHRPIKAIARKSKSFPKTVTTTPVIHSRDPGQCIPSTSRGIPHEELHHQSTMEDMPSSSRGSISLVSDVVVLHQSITQKDDDYDTRHRQPQYYHYRSNQRDQQQEIQRVAVLQPSEERSIICQDLESHYATVPSSSSSSRPSSSSSWKNPLSLFRSLSLKHEKEEPPSPPSPFQDQFQDRSHVKRKRKGVLRKFLDQRSQQPQESCLMEEAEETSPLSLLHDRTTAILEEEGSAFKRASIWARDHC